MSNNPIPSIPFTFSQVADSLGIDFASAYAYDEDPSGVFMDLHAMDDHNTGYPLWIPSYKNDIDPISTLSGQPFAQLHTNSRRGKAEDFIGFQGLVIEIDYLIVNDHNKNVLYRGITPKVLQRLAVFHAIQKSSIPFSLLVDSGGKSIHVYITISDLPTDRRDLNLLLRKISLVFGKVDLRVLVGSLNKHHLLRLPGGTRDTGEYQGVLGLGPHYTMERVDALLNKHLSPAAIREAEEHKDLPITKQLPRHWLRVDRFQRDLLKPHEKGSRGTDVYHLGKTLGMAGSSAPTVTRAGMQGSFLFHFFTYVFDALSDPPFFDVNDPEFDPIERGRWPTEIENEEHIDEDIDFRAKCKENVSVVNEKEDQRAIILYDPDDPEVIDRVLKAMADYSQQLRGLFAHSGLLVTLDQDPASLGKRLKMTILNKALIRDVIKRAASFRKASRDKETGKVKLHKIGPPTEIVESIASRKHWAGVLEISSVLHRPSVTRDGEFIDQLGYHRDSGIALLSTFPIPDEFRVILTREQCAHSAHHLLDFLFHDFPFASQEDRAAFFSLVLTIVAKGLLRGENRPGFLITSNERDSGKTLAAQLLAIIATGFTIAVMPPVSNSEEDRKRISATLLESPPMVILDNCVKLGDSTWDSLFTSDKFKDRLLGYSQMLHLVNECIWMITGNNVVIPSDSVRRLVPINLIHQDRAPGFVYKIPDIKQYFKENSERIYCSALQIVRSFLKNGAGFDRSVDFHSFESWAKYIGSTVTYCGLPDPTITAAQLRDTQGASQDEDLINFLEAWSLVVHFLASPRITSQNLSDGLDCLKIVRHRPHPYLFAGEICSIIEHGSTYPADPWLIDFREKFLRLASLPPYPPPSARTVSMKLTPYLRIKRSGLTLLQKRENNQIAWYLEVDLAERPKPIEPIPIITAPLSPQMYPPPPKHCPPHGMPPPQPPSPPLTQPEFPKPPSGS